MHGMLGISSSFHDLSMWSAYCDEKGHVEKEGESDGEREREDGEGDRGERGPPWLAGVRTHSKSMRLVQVLAPTFVHPSGGALSLAGVAAATGLGVTVCHSVRLLLREVLEALPRMFATEPLLGAISDAAALRRARTFELYLLSLLHHGAWVGMALRRCLSRQGWHHDAGGSTRALVLSAGYHLYILLAIDSIWTHPLVTLQQIGELIGISSQLRSRRIGWLVPLSGGLRSLPQLFLSGCSALEHLGEPLASYPFRFLRFSAAASIVGAKAVATPLFLRTVLAKYPELHQPELLPRKVVTVADAALSVGWLASHFALHRAYRRWHHAAPSVVAPMLANVGRAAAHQAKLQAAAVALTTGMQLLYLIGPGAPPLLGVAAMRIPRSYRKLRSALIALLLALLALTRTKLPTPNYNLLRSLLIRSGLAGLMKEYHSFRLIEEVPASALPSDRGLLYACFPHGIVPYGVILFWLDCLDKNRPLGGLVASVLFKLPLLRQWLASAGMVPATARNLNLRLRTPGAATFLVPGGIAEMFLNDPDREVVQLANRKGFCKHALRSGSPIVPVYIFGQTQLFFTFSGRLQDLMSRLSRTLRVSLIPFVGRSWLSPFVPLQNPLTVVVGTPINVGAEVIKEPTQEQVDALHARFCNELIRIFDRYKGEHPGFAHKRLHIAGTQSDDSDDDADEARRKERRRLEQFHLFPAKL